MIYDTCNFVCHLLAHTHIRIYIYTRMCYIYLLIVEAMWHAEGKARTFSALYCDLNQTSTGSGALGCFVAMKHLAFTSHWCLRSFAEFCALFTIKAHEPGHAVILL